MTVEPAAFTDVDKLMEADVIGDSVNEGVHEGVEEELVGGGGGKTSPLLAQVVEKRVAVGELEVITNVTGTGTEIVLTPPVERFHGT